MSSIPRKQIISGGPGSGKSTLINGLQEQGYFCSQEVSRRMIIQETAIGSSCLPWLDISCFFAKVLKEMIDAWDCVPKNYISFFDRGIPDIIAYLKVAGIAVPEDYYAALALHPYHNQVLILPPWEDIYVPDNERWQSFEEAILINQAIRETYTECGFTLVDVPKLSPTERIRFVLDFIK
ncbi:AAA family ATPase [Pedobacter borealis]|uniref:AAA family ATPase n=1 Tax=Pedobacter borealis TaxID=475254 RepID=UPI000493190C|nr:AAA family ATPase [Pedobacter borealis]